MIKCNQLRILLTIFLLFLSGCSTIGGTDSGDQFRWTVPSDMAVGDREDTAGLLSPNFHEEHRNGNDILAAFVGQKKYRELFEAVRAEQGRRIELLGAESAVWEGRARFVGSSGNFFILYPPSNIYINQRWKNYPLVLGSQQDASLFTWTQCAESGNYCWSHINTKMSYGSASLCPDEIYLIISWQLRRPGVSVYKTAAQGLQTMQLPATGGLSKVAIRGSKWIGFSDNDVQFGEIIDNVLQQTVSVPFDTSEMTWSHFWITTDANAAIFGNFFVVSRDGAIKQIVDIKGEISGTNPPDAHGNVHSVAYIWDDRGYHTRRPVKIDTVNVRITFSTFSLPSDAEVLNISPCGTVLIARADSMISARQRRLMHPPYVGFRVRKDDAIEFLGTTSSPAGGWFVPERR